MLRGLIVFLVGAGLITAVYAMRSAVPVGSATSRLQQPATPAGLISTAMTPSLKRHRRKWEQADFLGLRQASDSSGGREAPRRRSASCRARPQAAIGRLG